jgi:hypothetical protein
MSDESEDTVSGALTKIEEALHWGYEHAIEGVAHLSGAEECADEYLRSNPDAEAAIESLNFLVKVPSGRGWIPFWRGRAQGCSTLSIVCRGDTKV